MFGWLARKKAGTALQTQAQPASINQPPSEREVRNKARVRRLQAALAVATDPGRRASLAAELQRRATTGR
jgi:hypothetical protein